MVKAGQQLKLPWTRYKSVQKAKTKQRHQKVEAWKSGLNADRIVEKEAKTETDNTILAGKVHYKNKIVEQSKDNPKRFWNYTTHDTIQYLPAPSTWSNQEEQSTQKTRKRPNYWTKVKNPDTS